MRYRLFRYIYIYIYIYMQKELLVSLQQSLFLFSMPPYSGSEVWDGIWNETHSVVLNFCLERLQKFNLKIPCSCELLLDITLQSLNFPFVMTDRNGNVMQCDVQQC